MRVDSYTMWQLILITFVRKWNSPGRGKERYEVNEESVNKEDMLFH